MPKVALFRRLFQGREDVYAVRWERRDGRGGYSPAAMRVAPREEAATRPFRQVVMPRITQFGLPAGAETWSIQDVYGALSTAEARNNLICADVLKAFEQGRTLLVLTERTEHLAELERRLDGRVSTWWCCAVGSVLENGERP